jgi:hypothetical protein
MMAGRSAHECGGRGRGSVGRVRGVCCVCCSPRRGPRAMPKDSHGASPQFEFSIPTTQSRAGREGEARRVNSGLDGGLFRVVGRLEGWRRKRLARMALSDAVFWRRECCWPRKVCKVGWACGGIATEVAPRFVYRGCRMWLLGCTDHEPRQLRPTSTPSPLAATMMQLSPGHFTVQPVAAVTRLCDQCRGQIIEGHTTPFEDASNTTQGLLMRIDLRTS